MCALYVKQCKIKANKLNQAKAVLLIFSGEWSCHALKVKNPIFYLVHIHRQVVGSAPHIMWFI